MVTKIARAILRSMFFFCSGICVFFPLLASEHQINRSFLMLQNTERNYFCKETDSGMHIFQRLSWQAVHDILQYEVMLEQSLDDSWQLYDVYETTKNVLEVSLAAGKWRYAVRVIDLLGNTAWQTPPKEFYVKQAFMPAVEHVEPQCAYLDNPLFDAFSVSGENLLPLTRFSLVNGTHVVYPKSFSAGTPLEILFDEKSVDVGEWTLRAENPGGFCSEIPVAVSFRKPHDFSVSAGYAPIFMSVCSNMSVFKTPFFSNGAAVHGTFVMKKRRAVYSGIGFDVKMSSFSEETNDCDISSSFFSGYASSVHRFPLIKNRLLLEARAGLGCLFVSTKLSPHVPESETAAPFAPCYVSAMCSCSGLFFIRKPFFIESGLRASLSLIPDMLLLDAQPFVCAGFQL